MKPHMAHINNTLVKKQLVEKAKESPYEKYKRIATHAMIDGMTKKGVIRELEAERERIQADHRNGDPLFTEGLILAQQACIDSINRLIVEIQEEIS